MKGKKFATANVERLLTNGANINAADHHGQSSLILAAQFGRRGLTMQLLRHGPDVDQQDNLGKTTLDSAKQRDQKDVCKDLLSHIAGERPEEKDY
jgi:ankyrin repeat protein